jgi:hypothetical protein
MSDIIYVKKRTSNATPEDDKLFEFFTTVKGYRVLSLILKKHLGKHFCGTSMNSDYLVSSYNSSEYGGLLRQIEDPLNSGIKVVHSIITYKYDPLKGALYIDAFCTNQPRKFTGGSKIFDILLDACQMNGIFTVKLDSLPTAKTFYEKKQFQEENSANHAQLIPMTTTLQDIYTDILNDLFEELKDDVNIDNKDELDEEIGNILDNWDDEEAKEAIAEAKETITEAKETIAEAKQTKETKEPVTEAKQSIPARKQVGNIHLLNRFNRKYLSNLLQANRNAQANGDELVVSTIRLKRPIRRPPHLRDYDTEFIDVPGREERRGGKVNKVKVKERVKTKKNRKNTKRRRKCKKSRKYRRN